MDLFTFQALEKMVIVYLVGRTISIGRWAFGQVANGCIQHALVVSMHLHSLIACFLTNMPSLAIDKVHPSDEIVKLSI